MRKHLIIFTATLSLFAGLAGADTIREIRLTTVDDLGLSAAYYPVSTNSAAAVILLHAYGKTKDEWGTVGVSGNIIEASLQALVDSMEYVLLRK